MMIFVKLFLTGPQTDLACSDNLTPTAPPPLFFWGLRPPHRS